MNTTQLSPPCLAAARMLTGHQRRAHQLATSAISHAQCGVVPFTDKVGTLSLVAEDSRIYLWNTQAMERQHKALAPRILHLDNLVAYDPEAANSWEHLVLTARVSVDAINVATWV